MKIEHHIAVSSLIAGILYMFFKSWGISIASLVVGIFIDIDHVFDYLIEHRLTFDLNKFMTFFYKEKHKKITLLFHAWEWLLCLGILTVVTNFNPWLTGAFAGYGHHIISDYLYSKTSIKTYSLIWRWKKKFNSELLFPRNRGYEPF